MRSTASMIDNGAVVYTACEPGGRAENVAEVS
jgi:hypothetical protein